MTTEIPKARGPRPRATDPLVIIEGSGASYVVFQGYAGDADGGGDEYTCLRFKTLLDRIDLPNIHVEPRLRGCGVAERLVRAISDAHPGLPLSFSTTNGHSRRLARKLAQRIPLFDAGREDQQFYLAEDRANGFYAEVAPRAGSLEDSWRDPP